MFSKGFTIIELLISIFVLTIGIVAVLYIFPFGAQVQRSSQMATVAIQLCQGKMEEIISKPYHDILIGTIKEEYGFNLNYNFYKRETRISYFDPQDPLIPALNDLGIKKIEVIVFWRQPLTVIEKEIKLATLIAER